MGPLFSNAVLWSYPVAFGLVSLGTNSYEALYKKQETAYKAIQLRRIERSNKSVFLLHCILAILFAVNTGIAAYVSLQHKSELLFSSEAYLGAIISILLIFCSSLLPDPDLPYSPNRANFRTWLLSIAYETAILTICFISAKDLERGRQNALEITCEALGAARVVILSLMAILFVFSRCQAEEGSSDSETESLLSPDQSINYGSAPAATSPSSKDAQTVSAFNYLAGFRDLVPYL